MNLINFNELNKKIQLCNECNLHKLSENQYDFDLGRGKLTIYGNGEILFLGQNPSVVRFPNCNTPCDAGVSKSFVDSVEKLGLDRGSFSFTNVVKCSTLNNLAPSLEEQQICCQWLKLEIELIQPRVIVALGRVAESVVDNLNLKVKRFNIWHPSYVRRFPKYKLLYIARIKEIIKEVNDGRF